LGTVKYQAARSFIRELLHPLCKSGHGFLVFCNHPPTVTFGKNMTPEEKSLVKSGFGDQSRLPEFLDVDRGGQATFHDTTQLMIYPIVYLPNVDCGVRSFVEHSLSSIVLALAEIGVLVEYDKKLQGIWHKDRKLASVGFRILDRLSDHGIALCLDEAAQEFSFFSPCGIEEAKYASVYDILGSKVSLEKLITLIGLKYNEIFGH
jgi:lipoyl(octanoyl) transferase